MTAKSATKKLTYNEFLSKYFPSEVAVDKVDKLNRLSVRSYAEQIKLNVTPMKIMKANCSGSPS